MSIPTVPGSEIDVATVSPGAKLDAGAMLAPSRARQAAVDTRFRSQQQVTRGMDDLGEAFGGLANDMAKVREASITSKASVAMREAQQSFIESTQGDPNEKDWTNRAREIADTTRDRIMSEDSIPPRLREQLNQSLKDWTVSLQIHAQTMARVQSVNRATQYVTTAYDAAAQGGQASDMQAAVNLGRSAKLDPVKMDFLEKNIPRTLISNAIETGLANNPNGTYEMLKSGEAFPIKGVDGKDIDPKKALKPAEYENLLNKARTRNAEYQKQNAQDIYQNADPDTGYIPEDLIRQQMDSGAISSKAGNLLLATQKRKAQAEDKKEDDNNVVLLSARIHDPNSWSGDTAETARDFTDQTARITNPAKRQQLITDINRNVASLKKTGRTDQKPLEAQVLQQLRDDMQTNSAMLPMQVVDVPYAGAKTHLFSANEAATSAKTVYQNVPGGIEAVKKMKPADFAATYGDKTTKDQVIQEIEIHHARLEEKMREWFKTDDGQKADFDKANDHRKELERPYVLDAVRQTLTKKPPAIIKNKDDYEALPAGASYNWNGQIRTKQ